MIGRKSGRPLKSKTLCRYGRGFHEKRKDRSEFP